MWRTKGQAPFSISSSAKRGCHLNLYTIDLGLSKAEGCALTSKAASRNCLVSVGLPKNPRWRPQETRTYFTFKKVDTQTDQTEVIFYY